VRELEKVRKRRVLRSSLLRGPSACVEAQRKSADASLNNEEEKENRRKAFF